MSKIKTVSKQDQDKQDVSDTKHVQAMSGTTAGHIWSEIKDMNIDMFALPNQTVSMHCNPVNVEPSKLYVLIKSTAVLPALETAIGSNYSVERSDKFIIVSRA